ncbi:MAG: hypothetical protein KY410_00925 [Proteobacteria bacterium]|nr:hypothetical protein [Pseudomonadota bacterium]
MTDAACDMTQAEKKSEWVIPNSASWIKAVLASLVALTVYYLPLFFPETAVVRVHDNLDSIVVFNHIVAEWIRNLEGARLALNGNLPIWAIEGLHRPLTYLYLLPDSWHAYLLTDILVRSIALAGGILLAMELRASRWVAALGAICFSLSISYTTYGLSIAALPMVLWLLTRMSHATRFQRVAMGVALVLAGWNSSLAFSGIFFVALALPILRFGINTQINRWTLAGIAMYAFGLVLGSLNIFYAQWFSGIVWHRTEFAKAIDPYASNADIFLRNLYAVTVPQRQWMTHPWYHVSTSLNLLLATGGFVALLRKETRRSAWFLCAAFLAIAVFHAAVQTPLIEELRTSAGGLLRAFQFDRFYTLSSLLILCVWLLAAKDHRAGTHGLLVIAAVAQLALIISQTPHWRQTAAYLVHGKQETEGRSFDSYYMTNWFDAMKSQLQDGAVISVGLDPMVAPMNGVASLDGYFNLYPLEYKRRFREVIRNSLPQSGRENYFDKWGSRIYTFHRPGKPEAIDFCSAYRLGATHVLSDAPVDSPALRPIDVPSVPGPRLYAIEC